MASTDLFRKNAPGFMRQLMQDFQLNEVMAAGVFGNIGHECAGFHILHEIGQPEGKGGYGWGQWTGPRREQFLAWANNHGQDWHSDDANYGFLKHELETTERGAIAALQKTATLDAAVIAFERNYERAGVTNYDSREMWAQVALDAFRSQ